MEEFKFIDSKFRFCILAAKRAKQIIAGSKKRIEMSAENPLTIALQELEQRKVGFEILDENFIDEELGLLAGDEVADEEQEDVEEATESPQEEEKTD